GKPKNDKNEAKTITWYNMTDGYAKAKKEKKMLVIDAYTDWCYWCTVMDTMTFKNPSVVRKMNQYFVAVTFNPQQNKTYIIEKDTLSSAQLGRYLTKGGRIHGYPSVFVWKDLSNNSKIETYSGYIDTTTFHQVMNKSIQQ